FDAAPGPNGGTSDDILATLVLDHALPVIRGVVGRRLDRASRETVEDVCSTATTWLLSSLRRSRDQQSRPRELASYVAGIAARAAAQYIADLSPERARLRRKLRMLCSLNPRFFLSETEGRWLCGWRAYRGRDCASPMAVEACRAQLAATRLPTEFRVFAE